MRLEGVAFRHRRIMAVIETLAHILPSSLPVRSSPIPSPEPGILGSVSLWLLALVLAPIDLGVLSEQASEDKRPHVESDSVVEVRRPSDWLL